MDDLLVYPGAERDTETEPAWAYFMEIPPEEEVVKWIRFYNSPYPVPQLESKGKT